MKTTLHFFITALFFASIFCHTTQANELHVLSPHSKCDMQFVPLISAAEMPAQLPKTAEEQLLYAAALQKRYGFSPSDIVWGEKYPLVLHGASEKSYKPTPDFVNAIEVPKTDVVVVGAGPAGLTSAMYLSDANVNTMILEQQPVVGGLGAVGASSTIQYGRGAAYFTKGEGPFKKIYERLGLDYRKLNIAEPVDSYLLDGKYFFRGMWENEEAMRELPPSFATFKLVMESIDEEGKIAIQPIEKNPATAEFDKMSFADLIRSMPKRLEKLAKDKHEARHVLDALRSDARIDQKEPMQAVLDFLNLYGRSALGDHTDKVNAMAFLNFYISEMGPRYTSNLGDGTIPSKIMKVLDKRKDLVNISTSSTVAKISHTDNGVVVYYVKDGKTFKVNANSVVFSAPLGLAPRLIENYETIAPKHFQTVKSLKYRHYVVVNVHVDGHPWVDTYDLWLRSNSKYSQYEPTDVIDGRWMDFNGTKLKRNDDLGVLTIYMPLPEEEVGKGLDKTRLTQIGEHAIDAMQEQLNALLQQQGKKPIRLFVAEVNAYPYSIHLAEPGHFEKAKVLAQPVGRVFFANNNQGTPAEEEGVYRGYLAALEIRKKLHKKASRFRRGN